MHQNHLEDLLKDKLLGPVLRVSDSIGLGWGLGHTKAAGAGTTLRETLLEYSSRLLRDLSATSLFPSKFMLHTSARIIFKVFMWLSLLKL